MSAVVRAVAACAAVLFGHAFQQAFAADAPKTATHKGRLDPNDPADAVRIDQKMICSLTEGDPVVYWWKGTAYSRVPGEQDKPLFNVEGMNIRHCKNFADEKRGHGFRSVSREILLYQDLKTNEPLKTWDRSVGLIRGRKSRCRSRGQRPRKYAGPHVCLQRRWQAAQN